MATPEQNIRDWLAANPNATSAEIVRVANQYNVTPELYSRATGMNVDDVRGVVEAVEELENTYSNSLRREADLEGLSYWTDQVSSGALTLEQAKNAIANSQEAQKVKQVVDAYDTFLEREPDQEGLDYWRNEVVSGNLSVDDVVGTIATSAEAKTNNPIKAATAELYTNVLQRAPDVEGANFWSNEIQTRLEAGDDPEQVQSDIIAAMRKAESDNLKEEAADLFKQKVEQKDPTALGTIMYDLKSSGQRVTPQDLESLFGPEDQGGYENSTVAFAIARGLEEVNNALARGDTATAQRLQAEMQNPVAFRDKYKGTEFLSNDIPQEIRKTFLTENNFYGRSDPQGRGFFEGIADDILGIDDSGGLVGSTKAFLENPVEALDRWKDNPAFRAGLYLIPGYGPLIAATTTIVSKYDTGETPGLMDWASLAMAGADFTAPGGAGANTASTATKLMDQGVDPSIANKIASQTSATSSALSTAGNVLNTVGGGAQSVINRIVDDSGIRDYIGAAGQVVDDPALQGAISGTVGGLIEEVTGGDFVKGFLPELKGTSIDVLSGLDVPGVTLPFDNLGGSLSNLSGMLGDLNIPNFDVNLPNVNLPDVSLANLDGLDLSGLNLDGVGLNGLGLEGVDLSGLNLGDVNLGDLNLAGINLPNVNLPNVNIPNLNIPGVDLPSSGLSGPTTNVDVPSINLPSLLQSVSLSPGGMSPEDLDLIRGGRGMFGTEEEDVKRISELLLAGVSPQALTNV